MQGVDDDSRHRVGGVPVHVVLLVPATKACNKIKLIGTDTRDQKKIQIEHSENRP